MGRWTRQELEEAFARQRAADREELERAFARERASWTERDAEAQTVLSRLRAELTAYYRPHNEALRQRLGLRLDWPDRVA